MKRILSWLLIIGLLPLSSFTSVFAIASLPSGKTAAKVIEVIDGDTIKVDINGEIDTVRILGIDTPEKYKTRTGHKECYGDEATEYAIDTLSGATINLEKDTKQKARDIYNRMLAHVWIGETLYGVKIIEDGYSFRYTKATTKYQSSFVKAEKSAKKSKKGVWDVCKGKRTPLETIQNGGSGSIENKSSGDNGSNSVNNSTNASSGSLDSSGMIQLPSTKPQPLTPPVIVIPSLPSSGNTNFSCSNVPRYCSGVKTREEAQFYLNQCGATKFDRDQDGIACEDVK